MNNGIVKNRFTLTELLIVISIFAVLLSLLSPALRNALVTSKRMSCLTNQKSLVQAILSYAGDNGDYFPRLGSWSTSIPPPVSGWDYSVFEYTGYLTSIYVCPGQSFINGNDNSFSMNGKTYRSQLSYTANGIQSTSGFTITSPSARAPTYPTWSHQVNKMKPDTFLLVDQMTGTPTTIATAGVGNAIFSSFGRGPYKGLWNITLSNHDMQYSNMSSVDGSAKSYHILDMLGKPEFGTPTFPTGNEFLFYMQFTAGGRFYGF